MDPSCLLFFFFFIENILFSIEIIYRKENRDSAGADPLLWLQTPKIDTATQPFLKFDRRHGQGLFLNLTCDMGPK